MPQRSIPCVLMRGGTSKGIFVATHDLSPAGLRRDALVLELLSSPDPGRIDGLGGALSSTSKLMAHDEVFMNVFDVSRFRPLDEFRAEVSKSVRYLKGTPLPAGFDELSTRANPRHARPRPGGPRHPRRRPGLGRTLTDEARLLGVGGPTDGQH